ncbi:preprotein translocase subunit SecG [Rhodobacteraceae bacterium 2CG4]|uniref:Protein-export membrane protein SecG n=1 Tax=Halovulum marinum TaxID=2662447 RepID=A0A6L5Z142_9RHOB|nr:preprotein translocase subunit SecG [Halovulum marinum]MSU89812.1 preprotein translocase subunit SecG [Halovulum marinum]
MENIVLIIHLLLALALILSVLLQRSEGGGLGIGGGGGGVMSGRPPTTPMAKVTWILAIGFICTSLALTWIATRDSAGSSVIDRVGVETPAPAGGSTGGAGGIALPPALDGGDLTPPAPVPADGAGGTSGSSGASGPAVPPPAE